MRYVSPVMQAIRPRILSVVLVPVLLLLCATACVTAGGGVAVSNIPLGNRSYEIVGTEEAEVAFWTLDLVLLGFPLSDPPVNAAEQQILAPYTTSGDGAEYALINLRYWNDQSVYFGVVNRKRFVLQADVVRLAPLDRRRR